MHETLANVISPSSRRHSDANSTRGNWSLERIQKSCLSIRSGSFGGNLRTNSFRNGFAHAARIRSKPSRRRSSWSKPHLFGCPVCGVIRADLRHPNRGDGSSSGNRSRECSGKNLRQVYFQVELGRIHICTTSVGLQAISGPAIQSNGHLRTISFEAAMSMPHASRRNPRGGSVSLSLPAPLTPCRKPPPILTFLQPTWYPVGTLTSNTIGRVVRS